MNTTDQNKAWIVNTNITQGFYPIEGAYREKPYTDEDSGWRLVSTGDTPEFINNPLNVLSLTAEEVYDLEPELEKISHLPIGTEVKIIFNEDGITFVDFHTSEPVL